MNFLHPIIFLSKKLYKKRKYAKIVMEYHQAHPDSEEEHEYEPSIAGRAANDEEREEHIPKAARTGGDTSRSADGDPMSVSTSKEDKKQTLKARRNNNQNTTNIVRKLLRDLRGKSCIHRLGQETKTWWRTIMMRSCTLTSRLTGWKHGRSILSIIQNWKWRWTGPRRPVVTMLNVMDL